MKNKPLFAFWKYDQFPFVLGGEVTDMKSDGAVETKEYGPGYYFTPIKFLPLDEGKKKMAELRKLQDEYRDAQKKISEDFLDKRKLILKV